MPGSEAGTARSTVTSASPAASAACSPSSENPATHPMMSPDVESLPLRPVRMLALAATPARSELPQPGAGAVMRTRAAQPLRGFCFPSIVITLRGGQAPGQGRRIEGTMPHDKIRAATRKRMAETGEPYTVARRAVVSEHQAAGAESRPPGAGSALRMSDEIHDWLTDLRGSDQSAALRVVRALVTLMREGASLGDPLVVSTADSWPWALAEALDRSYQDRLDRLTALRRGEADAAILVKDLRDQAAALEAMQAELEAAQVVGKLAAVQQQAAEGRRLLPRMIEARNRLREQNQQVQARVEASQVRKETLKARHAAAPGSLQARQAMEALDLADDDGAQHPQSSGEAARGEAAKLADVTAQMERELGQETLPEGLTERWPGAAWHEDIRILCACE